MNKAVKRVYVNILGKPGFNVFFMGCGIEYAKECCRIRVDLEHREASWGINIPGVRREFSLPEISKIPFSEVFELPYKRR